MKEEQFSSKFEAVFLIKHYITEILTKICFNG